MFEFHSPITATEIFAEIFKDLVSLPVGLPQCLTMPIPDTWHASSSSIFSSRLRTVWILREVICPWFPGWWRRSWVSPSPSSTWKNPTPFPRVSIALSCHLWYIFSYGQPVRDQPADTWARKWVPSVCLVLQWIFLCFDDSVWPHDSNDSKMKS